jgi:hypothetical protein
MLNCGICGGSFEASPDSMILCKHKDGAVHMGCCVDRCSWNRAPCENSVGVYQKQTKK